MILVVAGVATMVASAAGVSCGVDAMAASQPSAPEEGSQLTPPLSDYIADIQCVI